MLLTPNQTKEFENYYLQENETILDDYYNTHYYDIFRITFKKQYSFLGVFKYTKYITKKYKFKRRVEPNDKVGYVVTSMSNEAIELRDQLKALVSNKWFKVSEEKYNFFLKKFPERFV